MRDDGDVVVTVLSHVFVEEAKDVHQFVDDGAHLHAPFRVEVQCLSAPCAAHRGGAAVWGRQNI